MVRSCGSWSNGTRPSGGQAASGGGPQIARHLEDATYTLCVLTGTRQLDTALFVARRRHGTERFPAPLNSACTTQGATPRCRACRCQPQQRAAVQKRRREQSRSMPPGIAARHVTTPTRVSASDTPVAPRPASQHHKCGRRGSRGARAGRDPVARTSRAGP
ncbi:DUF5133 domain-containing protein [Streptomyces sp. NPDC005209]|uniref:DUF5133 domain-containing protein n=1 Tax=Streptomyces sp. NPDC005209 TaxID=3156715 RepID=UPI0033B6D339